MLALDVARQRLFQPGVRRPTMDQPENDLLRVWEAHTAHEFVTKDVDATMQTMVQEPEVIHVPVATGGRGWANVRNFYAAAFIGHCPQDTRLNLISRTIGAERVVDEMLFSFTHDMEVPWMLPGVAPTGRRVEIPLVAIISIQDGRIASEHIYWDQASVLAQIGLLDETTLPILGAAQPRALTDAMQPLNKLIQTFQQEGHAEGQAGGPLPA
jgi:carboxymethylenebutenolidase